MRTDGGTERQTDMTKLIVAFRKFSNAPEYTVWAGLNYLRTGSG